MPFIFMNGLGALIRLECPHCGEIQARARKPAGSEYECRKCHRILTTENETKEGAGNG